MDKKILNGTVIKWMVIVAMIIDHWAGAFLQTDSVAAMICHTIGKLTGPTMFFFLVEGYHHTRSIKKYLLRLTIFAIVSHFPYCLFVNYGKIVPFKSSVGATLLCGLIALLVLDKVKNPILKWLSIILLIGVTNWCDWPLWGVIIVIGFGLFYGDSTKQWIAYAVINAAKILVSVFFMYGPNPYRIVPLIISPILVYIMFRMYDGTRGTSKFARVSKWAFYVIYPVQFIVIGVAWLLLN